MTFPKQQQAGGGKGKPEAETAAAHQKKWVSLSSSFHFIWYLQRASHIDFVSDLWLPTAKKKSLVIFTFILILMPPPHRHGSGGGEFDVYLQGVKAQSEAFRTSRESFIFTFSHLADAFVQSDV